MKNMVLALLVACGLSFGFAPSAKAMNKKPACTNHLMAQPKTANLQTKFCQQILEKNVLIKANNVLTQVIKSNPDTQTKTKRLFRYLLPTLIKIGITTGLVLSAGAILTALGTAGGLVIGNLLGLGLVGSIMVGVITIIFVTCLVPITIGTLRPSAIR